MGQSALFPAIVNLLGICHRGAKIDLRATIVCFPAALLALP